MKIKSSEFREDIEHLLDMVLESGKALEIEHKGSCLKLIPDCRQRNKLQRLVKHDCIVCDPEELVHMEWLNLF